MATEVVEEEEEADGRQEVAVAAAVAAAVGHQEAEEAVADGHLVVEVEEETLKLLKLSLLVVAVADTVEEEVVDMVAEEVAEAGHQEEVEAVAGNQPEDGLKYVLL